MAILGRFSAVDKIKLVATGNSLIVCGSTTEPTDNTSELIKADGTTTRDWSQDGSTANLTIVENSTIVYAELIWYSSVFSNVATALDLRSIQDNSITFSTSKGSYQIAPKYTESYISLSGTIDRFRAADVTSYVEDALSGDYTVSKVPISIPSTGLSNSRGGWTLVVIYKNDAFKPQKVTFSSGISVATPDNPLQTAIAGFTTSSDATFLNGSVTLICANGQPLNGAEYVYAGPSFAELSNIGNAVLSPNPNPGTAPNNPGNSFFSGTINVADPLSINNGLINIKGTNGTNNNDGFVLAQKIGARNKWDITNVDISKTLVTNQTLIAGQITTGSVGDGVQLVSVGTQVLAKAPNMIATIAMYDIDGDKEYNIEVGETTVYAIKIRNDGDQDANDVIISAVLDSATSFVPGSVSINGVINPTANIEKGINLGIVASRAVITVLFTVEVNGVPAGGLIYQYAKYSYQFISGIDTITNYGKTNTVQVVVQDGLVSVNKSASKSTALIKDIITYTIDIKNIGTEIVKEVFFQDKVDQNSSFVKSTLTIDGTSYLDYDPTLGFYLPDLSVGESKKIVFQSKINSLPPSTKLDNLSCVSYGYIFNQHGYLKKNTVFSNSTSIEIQYVDVIGERVCNNYYPKVGDTVTYKLSLTNIGNINTTNVQILEPEIPGATFVSGSVKINGGVQSSLNPFEGFILPDPIEAKTTTNVEYKVLVNSMNPENLIENIAKVPFKYQIADGGNIINGEKDSNKVDTVANYVCVNVTKSVDKEYATIGDTLYYKVVVNNLGNITATDTVFLDNIQAEASFVNRTVAINGISYPSYNPNEGFTIGTVSPTDSIEITFQAKVNAVPTPNIIYNQSSLVYSYKPDPDGKAITSTTLSNTVQSSINKAKYTVVKSVDRLYAQVGDALVYKIQIDNTGTVPLTDMKFADFIGVYLSFITGSLYIDGINYPELNPSNQFLVGRMQPGDTRTIAFGARVIENPPVGYIPDIAEVILSYQENPNSPTITKTAYSNTVKTYVPFANVELVKGVDKAYATVGEVITYSFTASNVGNSKAINTFFSDNIQLEGEFVEGSVKVNGVSKPKYNPKDGFILGDIAISQVVSIEFKVKVDNLPTPNTIKNSGTISYSYYVDQSKEPVKKTFISNTVTTLINSYSASLTKVVNKEYATVGDEIEYTVVATNTGTISLTNVSLTDVVPSGATFVNSSVFIDGINKPEANPNSGFNISDVLPGGKVTVLFKVKVTSVPTPPQIKNTANIKFKYQLTPSLPYIDSSIISNSTTTNIISITVTNNKSVSKEYSTVGDTFTYTSVITNNGNVPIDNTNFVDNLQKELTFVKGSVKIDGTSFVNYDPNKGFTLESIAASKHVTVTFDVTVNSVPDKGYVTNISIFDYQYKINPNDSYILASKISNTVKTYINLGDLNITKSADRSVVRLTNKIIYSTVIANTGNTLLKNLFFKDAIQAESSFDTGTVYIDGVVNPNYNPNIGFNLSDLPIGKQTTISFEVTVNSIPEENQLFNKADINYSYYVDPNGSLVNKNKTSNITTVYVYDTIVSANKTVDKAIAKIGDTLNFTINIKNDGNNPAEHITFEDILDSHLSFIEDSVYINGTQKIGYNPNIGFDLDNIAEDTTTVIKFAAKVLTRPKDNIIYNFATIDYDYTVGTEVIPGSINTNTTQTYVAIGELIVNKTVDMIYATVGDNLAYTIVVKNTGSVNATELIFKDLTQEITSFNAGTVVIDGVAQPKFNPELGFSLGDLATNEYHTVSFSIHVDSLPENGVVYNTADVTFTYKLTQGDQPVTKTIGSNLVSTYIKLGNITATKSVDKAYGTIGDTLNYTIDIKNLGNASCFAVYFQDVVQSDAIFVSGSVQIDGKTYPDYDPNKGFNLQDIIGGASTTVIFAVKVKTLPVDYKIYNYATGSYKYYINPDNPPIVVEGVTNTVTTIINVGSLAAIKSVSKAYATIDDTLTYTVSIVNTGNTMARNVNFRDVIQAGLKFVDGSVAINGTPYPSYNPYSSYTLGNIVSGDTVIVKFDVLVTSVPTPSLVSNTANLTFYYRIDPNGSDIAVIVNSNTVATQINLGSLSLNKSVDKTDAQSGDELTYTVIITNTGNVRVDDVLFSDSLQSDISFNEGSVKIDGTPYPDYNPNTGFSLGNIETLASVTVTFTVIVVKNPTRDVVVNYAVANYSYKIDPDGQYYSKTAQSNGIPTLIYIPKLLATKVVNKAYATIQDILNYSILVKNNGNTTIKKMFFSDFLSNGAVFNAGTVVIDGVKYENYNPIKGFNMPTDLIGGITSLVEYQATVNTLPTPPQVTNYAITNGEYYVGFSGPSYLISATSNTVSTEVKVGSLSNTKSVDKLYAKVDDILNYTSTIINTGNVTASSLFFTDILQSELNFVSGTVSIDGIVYPSFDPTKGFEISNLEIGKSVTVDFSAKVKALPTPAYVTNTSSIKFSYKSDPNGTPITKEETSNNVTTNIVLGKLTAVKIVDKSIATIGETLNYTITLTNVGNVIDNDVFFQDKPSEGVKFRDGSVVVSGVSQPTYNPTTGFSLRDIGIGNVVTVQFAVEVISVPETNKVTNQATIIFKFLVDPKQPPYSDTSYSNTVSTNIANGSLSVTKSVNKKYATIGEEITYTIKIVNIGNINATNVLFLDQTPQNTIFGRGSVTINGVSYPEYNPETGIDLNTMTPGQIITVVYKVKITELCK